MKAVITIKTLAGRVLAGAPTNEINLDERVYVVSTDLYNHLADRLNDVTLHPGDTITIEIKD